MSKIGERICMARKNNGLTQEELALKMGYKSKSTINKIEMGINDIPQSKIEKFAEVLGCTIPYLMGWDSDNSQEAASGSASDSITFSPEELLLVKKFRSLDKKSKETIFFLLQQLSGSDDINHEICESVDEMIEEIGSSTPEKIMG